MESMTSHEGLEEREGGKKTSRQIIKRHNSQSQNVNETWDSRAVFDSQRGPQVVPYVTAWQNSAKYCEFVRGWQMTYLISQCKVQSD